MKCVICLTSVCHVVLCTVLCAVSVTFCMFRVVSFVSCVCVLRVVLFVVCVVTLNGHEDTAALRLLQRGIFRRTRDFLGVGLQYSS